MAASNVQALIAKFAPPAAEFEVAVTETDVFRFKAIASFSEQNVMLKAAAAAYKALNGPTCSAALKPYQGVDETTFGYAYVLSQVAIEPRYSLVDWLELADKAGFLFGFVFQEVNKRQMAITAQADADHLTELKNA